MDNTLKDKIILGSTYKAHKKASIYGSICLEHLSLFKIILELKNYCQLNHAYEDEKTLERIAKDLQTKHPEICKYVDKRLNDKKFIN